MRSAIAIAVLAATTVLASCAQPPSAVVSPQSTVGQFKQEEGFVDANGVLIY